MPEMVKLIVVLDFDRTREFITAKKLDGIDILPTINPKIKDAVKEYVYNNTGYDNVPVAGLSRYEGNPGELKKIEGVSVNEFFPLKSDNILWELHMPDDMACSVNYSDLMNYSKLLDSADDEFEEEMYLDEFKEKITLGYPKENDADVISFIPFLDLSKCKFYARISPTWGIGEDLKVPGVEQVKLKNLDLF